MASYFQVEHDGFIFRFAREPADPSILHIYARHLTTIDDALRVWFDPDTEDVWVPNYYRFETESSTHVLYWTWLREGRVVLIISCFRKS